MSMRRSGNVLRTNWSLHYSAVFFGVALMAYLFGRVFHFAITVMASSVAFWQGDHRLIMLIASAVAHYVDWLQFPAVSVCKYID